MFHPRLRKEPFFMPTLINTQMAKDNVNRRICYNTIWTYFPYCLSKKPPLGPLNSKVDM